LVKTALILWSFVEQNPFAHIALAAWCLFSLFYIRRAFRNYEKVSPFLLQLIPFGFTMLGLLGTVAGCLIFSWGYKPLDFMSGVQTLFKGVMAAGVTTIMGVILSIVSARVIGLTRFKHEAKKALENNEATILKKMLRLLVADYERQDAYQDNELMAIDGVRDAIFYVYPKFLKRMDGLKKAAMTESGLGVAELVEKLALDLRRQAALLAQSQEAQNKRMDSLLQVLAGDGEQSLLGQMRALRAEQNVQAKAVFGKMVEAVEKAGALDFAPLVSGVDSAFRAATSPLLAEMKRQTQQNAALAEAADKRLEGLELALRDAAASNAAADPTVALADLIDGQGRQQETLQSLSAQNLALRDTLETQKSSLERIQELTQRTPEKIVAQVRQAQNGAEQTLGRVLQSAAELREAVNANGAQAAARAEDVERRVAAVIQAAAETKAKALTDNIQRAFAEYGGKLRGQLDRIERKYELDANASRETLTGEVRRIFDALSGAASRIEEMASSSQTLLADTGRIKTLIGEMAAFAETDKTLQAILEKVNGLGLNGKNGSNGSNGSNGANGKNGKNGRALLLAEEPLSRSVEQLITRLREIEDIRNADGKFWKQVQKQINDGIPIIMGGNKLQFREGIDLDGEFQERLNRSFLNLDKILGAIVDGYNKKSGGASLQ
jgi:hypothetical protein